MTDTDKRAAYIEGLRQLADFLAEHPEVPLPYHGGDFRAGISEHCFPIYLVRHDGTARESLATITRAMGNASKAVNEDDGGRYYVMRKFGAITLAASADRTQVCEKVVTGTREVTREIPDAAALAAVPKVTVTETVEDVEWVCQPLLKPPTSLLSVPAEVA